ncbi:hypothetical protein CupriaWKF_30450 [Cupriavidus sp. WKF15]|uniref:hypothetical protein n=1 Tax=Cupriavidus sp. WKF15 TaxID=3032282 RepID=UPI0023E2A85A|nr:hypothetical protein [Cupriavidus sp. WKF15]WER50685.1 hypothetical protein CupriaWKF_30450 [Cupriavidus sp. WKF15]
MTATVATMLMAISTFCDCRVAGSVAVGKVAATVPCSNVDRAAVRAGTSSFADSGTTDSGAISGSTSWITVDSSGCTAGGATSGVVSRTGIAAKCTGSDAASAVTTVSGTCEAAGGASAPGGRAPHFLQNFAPVPSSAPQPPQTNAFNGAAGALTGVPHDLQKRAPDAVSAPQFVQLVIPLPSLFIGISWALVSYWLISNFFGCQQENGRHPLDFYAMREISKPASPGGSDFRL